jgi:VWFA-related protein
MTVKAGAGSLVRGCTGGRGLSKSVLAGWLVIAALGAQAQQQAIPDAPTPAAPTPSAPIPDAPKPQALPGLGAIAPGRGTSSNSGGDSAPASPEAAAPAAPATPSQEAAEDGSATPTEGRDAFKLVVRTNFVEVPFTVKDHKGKIVSGLTSRDVRVYENNALQHITNFTTDAWPLSVALVIDQSMTHDDMTRVNDSLGALAGAFSQYDMVAVFTYNNGPKMVTDFTAAQSPRLAQAVEISKGSGRDALLAGDLDGPTSQNTVINNQNFDPNTSSNRGHSSMQINPPRDVHTLNDAILRAATSLTKTGPDRRRVVYVISNGNEYGSEAKTNDVIKYLQRNNIEVDGTLVGDSSLPVVGFLNKIHLPLMMRDNVLPTYTAATGGNVDAEFRTGEIEKSFARITEEVRGRYVLGYYTHEPFIDGKFRPVNVVIKGHGDNLDVIAKKGYYPSAMEAVHPPVAAGR